MYSGPRQVRFEDKRQKVGWWICVVEMPGSKFSTQTELNSATPRAPYRIWVRPISEGGMLGVRSGLQEQTLWPVCSLILSGYFLLYRLSHSVSQTRNVGSKMSFLPCYFSAPHMRVKEVKGSRNPRLLVTKPQIPAIVLFPGYKQNP